MEEGIYKGIKWQIIYAGYEIQGIGSFQPYAGNKLLDMPEQERDKKLKAMIRYQINKNTLI